MKWWLAAILLAACKAPAAVPLDAPASPWAMGSNLPIPRLEPGVAAIGQAIAVVGGSGSAEVDEYDTAAQTWTRLPDAPVIRASPQVAAIGTTLYLIGGLDGSGAARGDAYAIDIGIAGATWQPIAAIPAGFERGGAGVVVTPPRIYLLGGVSSSGATASVMFYDSIADAWTTDALADLPAPRAHPAATRRASDGTFIVTGGFAIDGTAAADTFWLTSDQQASASDTWAAKTAMPTPRGDCAYGVVQDHLLCAGGESTTALATIEAYDSINDAWASYADMPSPRAGAQGAAVADALYVAGGSGALPPAAGASLYIFSYDDTATTR